MGNFNSSGQADIMGVSVSNRYILSDKATYELYAIEAGCVYVMGYLALTELGRLSDNFL